MPLLFLFPHLSEFYRCFVKESRQPACYITGMTVDPARQLADFGGGRSS
jgi:hypothetical protein